MRARVTAGRRRAGPRLALLALALLGAGCFGEDLPQVATERVAAGEVRETVSAPATVEAAATQDVAARVSGVVVALEVGDGERVRKGQVVLRLSSEQVDLAREQASAAEAASASVGGVEVESTSDVTRAAAEDAVRRLDERTLPRLLTARRRAEAIRKRDQRVAAVAAVEAVEASYQSTRAALLASGEALAVQQDATAESLSSALNQAVTSATAAQRLQAQAAQAAATATRDDLVVRAPFRGIVQFGDAAATGGAALPEQLPPDLSGVAGSLGGLTDDDGGGTLRVGAPVTAGQTLFSVFDLSQRYVMADVDEIDAPQVQSGQKATVLVDAFPDTTFDGIVERVQVAAETTETGGVSYPVRVRLIGPSRRGGPSAKALRVGMTASAEILTKTVQAKRVVPSRALLRREQGTVVYAVRDGRVAVVPLRVLALGEDRAAVRGDLRPDERVVVSGYEDLTDGDQVAVR